MAIIEFTTKTKVVVNDDLSVTVTGPYAADVKEFLTKPRTITVPGSARRSRKHVTVAPNQDKDTLLAEVFNIPAFLYAKYGILCYTENETATIQKGIRY